MYKKIKNYGRSAVSLAICFLITVLLLTSCDNGIRGSVRNKRQSEVYSVAYYSVPFASSDDRWDTAEKIETDSFGRELYFYCSGSTNSYIIIQKYDKSYAYYYDDYCYIFSRSPEKPSKSEIKLLKQRNNWNKKLNEDKMIRVPNSFKQSSWSDKGQYESLFKKYANIDESVKLFKDRFSTSEDGQLYIFREYSKVNDEYIFGNAYVVIFDWNDNIKSYMTIEGDITKCQDQIHQFKMQNKWITKRYRLQ